MSPASPRRRGRRPRAGRSRAPACRGAVISRRRPVRQEVCSISVEPMPSRMSTPKCCAQACRCRAAAPRRRRRRRAAPRPPLGQVAEASYRRRRASARHRRSSACVSRGRAATGRHAVASLSARSAIDDPAPTASGEGAPPCSDELRRTHASPSSMACRRSTARCSPSADLPSGGSGAARLPVSAGEALPPDIGSDGHSISASTSSTASARPRMLHIFLSNRRAT